MTVRRVAITGGSRGIGLATAEACVRAGMSVAIGARDGTQCASAGAELGNGAIGLAVEVRDAQQFDAFLTKAEEHIGPLDAVINNAGVMSIGAFADEDLTDTQRMLDVNVGGVLAGTRLALQRFLPRQHGHIVNVASAVGQVALGGQATYTASKHAVVGFTRAIRAETRGSGVRITLVMPGFTTTDMASGFEAPRGTRFINPGVVGDGIVAVLRSGKEEVYVPRELGPLCRFVAGTPPWLADRLKRVLDLDEVVARADMNARRSYIARALRS
jgi:NADP-dependent 3-hydroxy acid dehydrogenase YdfG